MNKEQEMREEWQEFVDSQVWQGEDEHTKNMGVGNVADYWLSKRRKELEELRDKVEGMKKKKWEPKPFPKGKENVLDSETVLIAIQNAKEMKDNVYEISYNQALSDVLALINLELK